MVQLKLRRVEGGHEIENDHSLRREQAEKEKWQTISLPQLKDLQSKLMLVAGKAQEGKQQVDRFVEVKI